MIVQRLDHVNIITDRLAETARFYAELLDLEERDGPPPLRPEQVRWMYDHAGNAILHLNAVDCPRAFDRAVAPGSETGAIHHIALRCGEFDEAVRSASGDGERLAVGSSAFNRCRAKSWHSANDPIADMKTVVRTGSD